MFRGLRSFFEAFTHPDKEDNPEKGEVAHAANLLQIGEFQVLQLAYRKAYGKDMDEHEVHRMFHAYMLHNEVPSYALRYARYVIELESRGMLTEQDPTYHRYDSDYDSFIPEGVRNFSIAVGVIFVVIAGAIALGHFASFKPTSVLPPYFEEEHLKKNPGADKPSGEAEQPTNRPRDKVLQGS